MSLPKLDDRVGPVRHDPVPPPNIADRYAAVMIGLTTAQRYGLIIELSVGYYEGWRPSPTELAHCLAAGDVVAAPAPMILVAE